MEPQQQQQQKQQQQQRRPSFKMESPQQKNTVMHPRRADKSSCCLASIHDNNNKRTAAKRTTNTSRRRSSLSYGCTNSRRGHSDISLVSSSGTSGLSHLARPSNKKRLRRSISWDVRPPKVHELKRSIAKPTPLNNKDDDELMEDGNRNGGGKNESWYSKEEYSSILREQLKSIMIMRYLRENGTDNSELDPEVYCERGLESYQSKELRNEIDLKRKIHHFLVIREQARQALVGTKDPELLRLLASIQSEASLRTAQLRAAMDQHEANQAMQNLLPEQEQEKKQPNFEDMSGSQKYLRQPLQADADSAANDPTTGIISLASLWAQEESPFYSYEADSKQVKTDHHEVTKVTCLGPSSSAFFQQGLLNKPPKPNTNADGPPYASSMSQRQDKLLVGFHDMCQSPFASKPSVPVMSPQAAQNAYCSSYANSCNFPETSPQQKHLLHRRAFGVDGIYNSFQSHPVTPIVPTSAFSSMNILDLPSSQQRQKEKHVLLPHEQPTQDDPFGVDDGKRSKIVDDWFGSVKLFYRNQNQG